MTKTTKSKTTTTNEKQKDKNSQTGNKVKYGYSINLSSTNQSSKEKKAAPEANKDTKTIESTHAKALLSKIATTKIPAENAIKSGMSLSEPQTKKPVTLKEKAKTALKHASTQGSNSLAKKLLTAGDKLISFITLKYDKKSDDVVTKARSPIMFGIWVLIITFVIGGLWSGFAPLDSSAGAQGFVVVSSKKQIIQHREGGIIEEIYVKEGEHVTTNQPLIKLSDKNVKAQLEAAKAQKDSLSKQLSLNQSQLESMNTLYEKGFVQKQKLIDLQSQEAQIIGRLSEVEANILIHEENMNRIIIKSPLSGTVNQLQVHTIGGTVSPGMILMTITPKEDDLIVEAYLPPQEIDSVYVGLTARVRIHAFKSRTTAPLDGIVTFISSDVIEPPQHHMQESPLFQRGTLYYKVKISIDKTQLRKISRYKDLELYPGMMADVMIVTGERTLLQYLLDPVTNTFWHAFIEK